MSVSARVSEWNVPGRQGHAAPLPDVPHRVARALEPASLQLDRGDGQAAEARGHEGERSLETLMGDKGSGTCAHALLTKSFPNRRIESSQPKWGSGC